jgi:hypothetical protein
MDGFHGRVADFHTEPFRYLLWRSGFAKPSGNLELQVVFDCREATRDPMPVREP